MKTAESRSDIKLEWGAALLTPEEEEIRVPHSVFPKLRQLGLLQRNRNLGLYQLSPMIYELMGPEYEGLMGGLRRVLGKHLDGPAAVDCQCWPCRRELIAFVRNSIPDWKKLIDQSRPGWREF